MTEMDAAARKKVLRSIPYALYVSSTKDDAGSDHLAILSWFTQVSFDPPLIALGVHRESQVHANLSTRPKAAIVLNLLGDDQQHFASEVLKGVEIEGDRARGTNIVRAGNGLAIIQQALGAIEAEVRAIHPGGDHDIVVCEVTQAHVLREGEALTNFVTGWAYGG